MTTFTEDQSIDSLNKAALRQLLKRARKHRADVATAEAKRREEEADALAREVVKVRDEVIEDIRVGKKHPDFVALAEYIVMNDLPTEHAAANGCMTQHATLIMALPGCDVITAYVARYREGSWQFSQELKGDTARFSVYATADPTPDGEWWERQQRYEGDDFLIALAIAGERLEQE